MRRKNAQVDWDHLRVFLAVARLGRVATAARRLDVRHTTVSRRLAALEAQLGAPLFRRTADGYQLTAEGQSVLPTAETMERSAIAIGARVRESAGRLAGRVRLGIPPEFASDWLAPRLPEFRQRYPEIQLQVLVGTRALDLSRGEAELAIRTPRPHQVGLVTARVARTTIRLYASRVFVGRKRLVVTDAESVRDVPLLIYTHALNVLQRAPWFQAVKATANVALETNSTHTLISAARSSAGVAVLPDFIARRYDDLVEVSEPVAENDVWLVTHPEHRRDPKVRATADFLKEIARELI